MFQSVVGKLQPILAKLPTIIASSILKRKDKGAQSELALISDVGAEASAAMDAPGFDLDAVTDADLVEPRRPDPTLTMDDLEFLLGRTEALPPGVSARRLDRRQWAFSAPGLPRELRISSDPNFVEENPDDVELWLPRPVKSPPQADSIRHLRPIESATRGQ